MGGLTGLLIAAFAAGPLLAAMEDPTQASVENLELAVRVRCDEVDEPLADAPVLRWTVDVYWEWSRTSVLPGGIRGWEQHTDALVLRDPGDDWWLATTRLPRQSPSRRPIGWQGGRSPSAGAIPPDLVSSAIDYGIQTSETHSHVRYLAAWVMLSQTWTEEWPDEAEVWYFHGDHWRLSRPPAATSVGLALPRRADWGPTTA